MLGQQFDMELSEPSQYLLGKLPSLLAPMQQLLTLLLVGIFLYLLLLFSSTREHRGTLFHIPPNIGRNNPFLEPTDQTRPPIPISS